MVLAKKAAVTVADHTNDPALSHRTSLARIPDRSIYERYQGRQFHGKTEFEVFQYAMENSINVLIEGPTGPGKTMASRAFAAREGMFYYSIPCNVGIEPSQLFGKYIPDGQGGFEWQDGGLTFIVRNGGLLLVNEINFMPERVASAIYDLLDERRELTLLDHKGETIRAHRPSCWCALPAEECKAKWVFIVADMNPGYAGTRQLNAALRNRFGVQLFWDYDDAVEAKLLKLQTLRRDIIPGLRNEIREGRILTPVSTNMLMEFERVAVAMGLDFAVMNFVNHFDSEERAAIKLTFDTFMANLAAELETVGDDQPDNPDDWQIFANDANWIYQAN